MSKQFSILMTEADLNALQSELINFCNPIFLQDRVTSADEHPSSFGLLGIPNERMGEVTLSCYVAASNLPKKIFFNSDPSGAKVIDDLHSNAVQLDRPFCKDGVMRAGRFYFQDSFVANGHWVSKDQFFLDWANDLFKFVKKSLTRLTHERVTYYVGSEAKQLLDCVKIKVAN